MERLTRRLNARLNLGFSSGSGSSSRSVPPYLPLGGGPQPGLYMGDHILTEATAMPQTHTGAAIYPDSARFEQTAHPQAQSPLFRLPLEIREQIYQRLWQTAGQNRHVFVKAGRYTHMACLTDQHGLDERQAELLADSESMPPPNPTQARRLLSSWSHHWKCEEAAAERVVEQTPFLALLLCCKKMYLDCRYALYRGLILTFHRVETAYDFLAVRKPPIIDELKYLDFAFQLGDQRRTDMYWHSSFTAFYTLCDALLQLKSLAKINIWLDAAATTGRGDLCDSIKRHVFDDRLFPIMSLSLPIDEEMELHEPGEVLLPRPPTDARGHVSYVADPWTFPEIHLERESQFQFAIADHSRCGPHPRRYRYWRFGRHYR